MFSQWRQHGVVDDRVGLAGGADDVDLVDVLEGLQAGARAGAVVGADVEAGLARLLLTVDSADVEDEARPPPLLKKPYTACARYSLCWKSPNAS
jgi:hypothetical protein